MKTKRAPLSTLGPFELPECALAAILFLESGDTLYCSRQRGVTAQKFVRMPDLARALAKVQIDTGWISVGEAFIRGGYGGKGDWYLVKVPDRFARILIEARGAPTIPLPPLYMAGAGKEHFVFATNTHAHQEDAPLFWAPFPNAGRGNICWGQNQPPRAAMKSALEAWRIFIRSPFNHHDVSGLSRKYPKDVRDLLMNLDGKKTYPVQDMVPVGTGDATLETLVDRLKGDRDVR
jgi:hypothetical protein